MRKSISNLITEQAIARYGNFPLDMTVKSTSETVMDTHWVYCCEVDVNDKSFQLYKLHSGLVYIVGYWETLDIDGLFERLFFRIAEIKLRNENLCDSYKSVDIVRVVEEYRGSGIATELYTSLVTKEKINLLSDIEQYFGARKLWAKLSKKPTLVVDILNTESCEFVYSGIKIEHGKQDFEIDDRVWSYENNELEHLRMVLKEIKND